MTSDSSRDRLDFSFFFFMGIPNDDTIVFEKVKHSGVVAQHSSFSFNTGIAGIRFTRWTLGIPIENCEGNRSVSGLKHLLRGTRRRQRFRC